MTPPAIRGAASRLRRRWLPVTAVALAVYLGTLAVLNLGSTPAGRLLDSLFPHIGPPGSLGAASILAAWSRIESDYVIRDLPGDLGTQSAERGMMQALQTRYGDRFNTLLTAGEVRALDQQLAGQRQGSIGVSLQRRCDGGAACPPGTVATELVIVDVLRGQPAERAGVRSGDQLVGVGGTPIDRRALSDDAALTGVTSRIRGPAGTAVRLDLLRDGRPMTVTVRRADLHLPSAYSQMLGRTLLVQVTDFGDDTARRSRALLADGQRSGATAVVLDLRHNPGGLVSAARDLTSEFVAPAAPSRVDVVVRRGRLAASGDPATARTVTHDRLRPGGVALGVPLAVLVDGNSASAAEIVAAALRDYHRGPLVGERTFGKGSVQVDYPLPDGNDLHLTVERWFGPNGESIEGGGVLPDRTVPLAVPDGRYRLDAESVAVSQDAQLQAALAAVSR